MSRPEGSRPIARPTICCLAAGLGFLLPLLTGCVLSRSESRTSAAPGALQTLTPFTYYEDGKLVFLSVNVYPARLHRDDEWIPLEIGVANRGMERLTVNVEEGLRLRDLAGHEWPTASFERTAKLRLRDLFDRQADPFVLRDILKHRLAVYQYVAPNFGFREQDVSFSRVVRLAKRSYTTGLILIANPQTQARGARFELWLEAPELKDPIFVPFIFD